MTVDRPGEWAGAGTLSVLADVRLDIDGVPAHLTSDGTDLTLRCADAVQVWAGLASTPLPVGAVEVDGLRGVGALAEALRSAGLALHVTDDRGPVAHLGAGVSSGLGRAATGSPAVRLVSLTAAAPLARELVRQRPSRALVPLGAAVGLAVLVRVLRRTR